MLLSSLSCDDYLHIITCSLALCIKAPSSGLEAMRPWINLGSGFPLISSQRGQNQGGTPVHVGTPVHMGSQIMDSVSPPRVVVRRQAVPLWLRNMPDVMGTQPAPVAASQMSTIPGMSLELLFPGYAPTQSFSALLDSSGCLFCEPSHAVLRSFFDCISCEAHFKCI